MTTEYNLVLIILKKKSDEFVSFSRKSERKTRLPKKGLWCVDAKQPGMIERSI